MREEKHKLNSEYIRADKAIAFSCWREKCKNTRVGTLIVATIYLLLIQN